MHTPHAHAHAQCLFNLFMSVFKSGFCSSSPAPSPHLRFLSPQPGDMVEMLVTFSGVIDSGYLRLPQAADASLDQLDVMKGKPGFDKSSGFVFFFPVATPAPAAVLAFNLGGRSEEVETHDYQRKSTRCSAFPHAWSTFCICACVPVSNSKAYPRCGY